MQHSRRALLETAVCIADGWLDVTWWIYARLRHTRSLAYFVVVVWHVLWALSVFLFRFFPHACRVDDSQILGRWLLVGLFLSIKTYTPHMHTYYRRRWNARSWNSIVWLKYVRSTFSRWCTLYKCLHLTSKLAPPGGPRGIIFFSTRCHCYLKKRNKRRENWRGDTSFKESKGNFFLPRPFSPLTTDFTIYKPIIYKL